MATIIIYKATDKLLNVEVGGSRKNIGGAVIKFNLHPFKAGAADTSTLWLEKTATITDGLNGKATIALDDDDTDLTLGTYAYQVVITYPDSFNTALDSGTVLIKGLSEDIMKQRIFLELASGSWQVELSDDEFNVALQDALRKLSRRIPILRYNHLLLTPNTRKYVLPEDVGYGVIRVDFVQPDPKPVAVFYANLLDVAPLKTAFMDSYDIFLRWRKTFMRVTSVAPQWLYEPPNILWLYNPVQNVQAGYFWHMPRKSLDQVLPSHEDWVYEYTLARCQVIVGRARSKFQGALPGPSKDLFTDGISLVEQGMLKMKELEEDLLKVQHDVPPQIS